MLVIFINHVQEFVQIKTLMRLQKTSAGGDEELIIKFMWPHIIIINYTYVCIVL